MPIPILIWVAVAAAVAAAAAIAVRKLLKKFEGKTIMIAGRVRSGKTVLSYYLAKGKKPSTVPDKQTPSNNEKHTSDYYKTINGKNKIKTILDCRHHDRATNLNGRYDLEMQYIEKSDIVFYLCDLKKIYENPTIENGRSKDYRDATSAEIDIFKGFCNVYDKPLILIGTHLDQIEGFDDSEPLQKNIGLMKKIKKLFTFPQEIIPVALTDKYIDESAKAILEEAEQYI